jgi:hypothetical protein
MGDVVRGNFCIVYLKLGSVYYPIACTKDVSIEIESDFLELAPRSSEDFREYEYGRKTGTISGSGLTKVNTAPDNLYTIFDLVGFQLSSQKVLAKYSLQDSDGNTKVFECNTLIRRANIGKSGNSMVTGGYELQISGRPVITVTPVENTNPQILTYEYEATAEVIPLVIDVISAEATLIVVYIDRDGTGGTSKKINIYPDGYGADEVQWDPSISTLYFGTSLQSGDRVKVIYVDPITVESAFALEDGNGNVIQDGNGNEITVE